MQARDTIEEGTQAIFADHLRPKEIAPKATRRRVDIHATGNALTNDSFLCLLKEAEAEKQEKHKQKSNKEATALIVISLK